jgi:hypothetical protein
MGVSQLRGLIAGIALATVAVTPAFAQSADLDAQLAQAQAQLAKDNAAYETTVCGKVNRRLVPSTQLLPMLQQCNQPAFMDENNSWLDRIQQDQLSVASVEFAIYQQQGV